MQAAPARGGGGAVALWWVRHGESTGNVARVAAYAQGHAAIDLDLADPVVPLSPTGRAQAGALGRWMAEQEPERRPTHAVVSPYLRARQTAEGILRGAGLEGLSAEVDERLRDREQGILDGLTWRGIVERQPEEAERRRSLGRFYYRPPGGESWADVALRVRALLADADWAGHRVLLVAHDVTILIARYLLEGLSEEQAVALSGSVANCSLTSYQRRDGVLVLERANDTSGVAAVAETAPPPEPM
jgi:probable phosphoglycerate mutase